MVPKNEGHSSNLPSRPLTRPLPRLTDEKVEEMWQLFVDLPSFPDWRSWWTTFTPYNIHNPHHISLVEVLSPPILFKFDLLSLCYFFVTKATLVVDENPDILKKFKGYAKHNSNSDDISGLAEFEYLLEKLVG